MLKYNRKRKQWLSFVGKLLLAQGLAIVEKKKLMEQPIQYTPKRRPFLDNTLDFNISHSNKRVICVIAPENRIGVDIQEKGDYRIEETSRFSDAKEELMRAMVWTGYGPPEVLQLQEVDKPVPQDNEVLVKVCAATVTAP